VLAGVELFGILGALLAIPIAGVVKVIGAEVLRIRRPDFMAERDAANEAERLKQLANPPRWRQLAVQLTGRKIPDYENAGGSSE
jgi:hypothetical protein